MVGFIGVGNMGGTLAQAAAKVVNPCEILVSSRTREKADAFAAKLGCHSGDNKGVAARAQWIFLGVKPHLMKDMLSGIAPVLKARKDRFVLVSMAAGLTVAQIGDFAGGDYPILRIMPNTPAAVGESIIQYCGNAAITEEDKKAFCGLMAKAGILDELPENLMDAASALSGCGPAYVYMFLEALADGAVACGIPRAKAMKYAAQTLVGAGKMVMETGKHPGQLKDEVCSPGGSTIRGVMALEENGLRHAAQAAVLAAFDRNQALGKV